MRKRRLVFITLSLGLCVSLCSILSVNIVRNSIINSPSDIKYYTDRYSGKIQSFLDVYKDIWNASTPDSLNIDRVLQYDDPIIVENSSGQDYYKRGGLEFCPIFTEGTIYDERVFKVFYSYVCELDFSKESTAPDPYYVGKKVNAVFGLGTVMFKENSKYSNQEYWAKQLYWNISYLMLECDGHLSSFFKPEGVNYKSLSEKPRVNYRHNPTDRYTGEEDEQLLFQRFPQDKFKNNLFDDDSVVLGIRYPRPAYFRSMITPYFPSADEYSNSSVIYPAIELNIHGYGPAFSGKKLENSFIIYYNDFSNFVSLKEIEIPSAYDLVNPYLREYELSTSKGTLVGNTKNSYQNICYHSKGWKVKINPASKDGFLNAFCYYTGKENTDDFEVTTYCDKPRKIIMRCIPIGGDDWRPTNPILGVPEFTNLNITNPVRLFQTEAIAKFYYPGQIGKI